jgi:PTS system mannitol-specific IIC component
MGSSAMGATTLRKKVNQAGLDIEVVNTSLEDIPADADIVITHVNLADRAAEKCKNVELITIDQFVGNPIYDSLVERLKK